MAGKAEPTEARDPVADNRETLYKAEANVELKDQQELTESLSIVDRLMRRTANKSIPLVLEDDLGDFTIQLRFMTREEKKLGSKLIGEFSKFAKPDGEDNRNVLEVYDETIDEMLKLAQNIILTDGVSEYLEHNSNVDDIIVAVIVTGLKGTLASVGDGLKGFRKE